MGTGGSKYVGPRSSTKAPRDAGRLSHFSDVELRVLYNAFYTLQVELGLGDTAKKMQQELFAEMNRRKVPAY